MSTARTRVQAGVAWLDSNIPDWRGHIDVASLNLAWPTSCVLGQLFAEEAHDAEYEDGYDYAYDKHFAGDEDVVDYGFDIRPDGHGTMHARYEELTGLWRAQL